MRVAIIGGGVSGLAAAMQLKRSGRGHQVTVYGGRHFGGSCRTMGLPLIERWADMGVNDFNRATYHNVGREIDELQIDHRPLEDTVCFYKLDGSLTYTLDGAYGTPMPDHIKDDFKRLQSEAREILTNPDYAKMTVGEYVQRGGYSDAFLSLCLYPRINAMFFCDEKNGPASMPIRSVLHYYVLQEGWGTEGALPPNRRYFSDGAGAWIEALAKACGATIHNHAFATVSRQGDGFSVSAEGVETTSFDRVIYAGRADSALISFTEGCVSPEVNSLLRTVASRYQRSQAVAHVYAPIMPRNRNAWRTYNVVIGRDAADQDAPFKYSMTYLINRHQNDRRNVDRNLYGGAEFFVTLNPLIDIPEQYVLDRGDGAGAAIFTFDHFVLDLAVTDAQARLQRLQGQDGLYFANGFTAGVGLHEEAWLAGTWAAQLIDHPDTPAPHAYDFGNDAEHHAPEYVRRALAML